MCCDAQYWLGAFVSSLSRSRVNAAIEIGDGDSCADADKKEIRVMWVIFNFFFHVNSRGVL